MSKKLTITVESWPIRGSFVISRGAKTEAEVVVCEIAEDGYAGRGECVPYPRYGESLDSVVDQIRSVEGALDSGASHKEAIAKLEPGAARNAVDCALWDLQAKRTGRRVHARVCAHPPRPVNTAMTISLADPEEMALQARAHAHRPLLKVKLGGEGDIERIHAVASSAPNASIIFDANECWRPEFVSRLLLEAAAVGAVLIEQPLPAGEDAILSEMPHPVPICADESAHTTADLDQLRGRYDAVNIKLDKAGGLTEALAMRKRAHELGFSVMIGCMVGTSLSMAPAILLAQEAEFVDLDGPLMLQRDRPGGLVYSASVVSPPSPAFWG